MSDTQTGNHNHNPDGSQRLAEQFEAVGLQILRNARNELYMNTVSYTHLRAHETT